MSKKLREQVFNKFNGKCAYCGCELPKKGWHIDHLLPVVRCPRTGKKLYPERDEISNMMPSCQSCNINKHSDSIENFRALIYGFINSLNKYSTQYKIAKRYGLIKENNIDIKFYFETTTTNDPKEDNT